MLATVSMSAIAGLALSACGSDNNTGGAGSSAAGSSAAGSAECGGKNTLTAEGSTAQQNAIATRMQVEADREAQQQAAGEALRKGEYRASPARNW